MSKYYVFMFYGGNLVRETQKAYGFAFQEDESQITWFAKKKTQILVDHFGADKHGLAVHPWLFKTMFGQKQSLVDVLIDCKQLFAQELEIDDFGVATTITPFDSEKVDGTVWAVGTDRLPK